MKPRVVSGMRPTGKLHLGHLAGALENWAGLQDSYDCFYFVADWHALTSDYADTSGIVPSGLDVICHAAESYIAKPFSAREAPDSPGDRPPYQGATPISDIWSAP